MAVLKANELKKHYGRGDSLVRALDGVSLDIQKGEFVSVVGSSGSGKTTLLHLLGGLDKPTHGYVEIGDERLCDLSDEELTIYRRRKIGFVFQSYNLISSLSVSENIVLPLELDGRRADKSWLFQILNILGLEKKIHASPLELSGGQQQRVAIARSLIMKPSLILADEPTGNLDTATSLEVMNLLKRAGEEFSQSIVMITHNEMLAQMAHRTLHIEDGLLKEGTYDQK